MAGLRDRLARIQSHLADAARRAGRSPDAITLVAVSKTVDAGRMREAIEAGQTTFGENRVQEARAKVAEVGAGAVWHLVGHLQRNKAREAARIFQMIHSVDSVELLRDLDRHAGDGGKILEVLVQVNVAREATKHGAEESQVPAILEAAGSLRSIRVVGLMILPPPPADPEASRPAFRRLKELANRLAGERHENVSLRHLSMGMSDDYEVAVEEGATLVRIGRALFGERSADPGKER
ncbi:MAG TPA: YggS family pyridoxal phosphate-dependent enzyme [Candidatus Polarisedimenticolia bacterium]|nr:YggS family pyridoxal phosphate-dependent enzyme [Candidatus Polarisedimenticolia bacterium]